jgi:hypothetical protein
MVKRLLAEIRANQAKPDRNLPILAEMGTCEKGWKRQMIIEEGWKPG